MNWNTQIGQFCESKLYGHPEILNSMSCIFISLIPMIGLLYNKYIYNKLTINILLLLIITGFTSFGYHWTGYYIFKHLDEIPMVISIWFGLYNSITLIGTNKFVYFIINLYFVIMLSINAVPVFNYLFPIMFGIAAFLLLIPLYLYKYSDNQSQNIVKNGVLISIISSIIWIISEKICNKYLILGHSIWHIGITLGMYYIMIGSEFSELKKYEKKNIKIKYIYNLIPIIY